MLIDLTRTFDESIPYTSLEQFRTVEQDGWNARMLHLYSHGGTHMDAPWHFACARRFIEDIPLETCLGPAIVIRLPDLEPRSLLTVSHLGSAATSFTPGERLLLHTGWSLRFGDPTYSRDFPRIGEELARWCVEHQVAILGVEPPSVADVHNLAEVTLIHRILLEGGVTIVEGLVNLDRIPSDRCLFGALPLKVREGDGAPCRAFASDLPLDVSP